MDRDLLTRIANALERIAPQAAEKSVPDGPALVWDGHRLSPVRNFSPLSLDLLTGIDSQKALVLENTRRVAAGYGAHDILLWGSRGSGKSALVKSSVGALQAEGQMLRLVEASTTTLESLPHLLGLLAEDLKPTIVFLDDLGFDANSVAARHIRSVLEGGLSARPNHVRLYVTSNRRHILPRDIEEQSSAINPRDVVDDQLALADRFGLSIGFHNCDQETYLAMIERYAGHLGLSFDRAGAILWSNQRGARSGRIAWSYVVELAGRAGKSI